MGVVESMSTPRGSDGEASASTATSYCSARWKYSRFSVEDPQGRSEFMTQESAGSEAQDPEELTSI